MSQGTTSRTGGVPFTGLLGLVIGITVASAVFAFPGNFTAAGASSDVALAGQLITGIGTPGLCLAFYYLNKLKPELKGGAYSYARAGSGSYVGFSSTWGYWLNELLSNISLLTLLFASIGRFLPLPGVGNNIPSVIDMSVVWWIAIILMPRDTKESTTVGLIFTVAKVIPILMPIVAIIFARVFSFETFMQNFLGSEGGMSLGKQVMVTTTITVWAFTGIEGAAVISGRTKRSSDVDRATMIGFLPVLILYIIISFLSAGMMINEELAALGSPPMAGILEHVVSPWGTTLMNTTVIIPLLGVTPGHTIMCTECSYKAAGSGAFCKAFTRTSKNGAPVFIIALISIIVQVFLVLLYLSESTYQVSYFSVTDVIVMPYFLSAVYSCKVTLKRENGLIKGIGIFSAAYAVWMVFAVDIGVILAAALLYMPGIFAYAEGQKGGGLKVLETKADKAVFVALPVLLAICVYFVGTGRINSFGWFD